MKIVSLVPSLTELVIDLGLEKQLVGRTKFCIHPKDKVKSIPKIGGTKNVNIQAVFDLRPDLVLANKEENTRADVEALQEFCPVHITEISNYKEALHSIQEIGQLTHRTEEANQLIIQIESNFEKLKVDIPERKSACYLIWKDPYMTVGHDTYIHDMLDKCNLANAFGEADRYPTINAEDISDKKPDFIFLSSEPYPFKEKHIQELKKVCPNAEVRLVDGEYFSWYGSRMVSAADYFVGVIKGV